MRRCTELTDPHPGTSPAHSAAVTTLRLLAQRITSFQAEAALLHARMKALVADHASSLLEQIGVGPDNAAALLIAAGENRNRIRSEVSFAALCGVTPVEASSGQTSRLRLNRGGDRQANAALYRITLSRLRWHQPTIDYMNRRLADGKTKREIIRCIKRYIARQLFTIIRDPQPSPQPT